ncbi:unnamed protein product [Dicrocoelium dendriticum]|nr:unnamed protein product [Dicrocoelium dendriticum]
MVERVIIDVPLDRSDHVVLLFECICYVEYPVEIADATETTIRYDILAQLNETGNWTSLADEEPASACEHFVSQLNSMIAEASVTKTSHPRNVVSFLKAGHATV